MIAARTFEESKANAAFHIVSIRSFLKLFYVEADNILQSAKILNCKEEKEKRFPLNEQQ